MKWLCFLFFSSFTIFYVWNGKDFYSKKQWLLFGLKFISCLLMAIIATVIAKEALRIWPSMSAVTVKFALLVTFSSIIAVLMAKLLVLLICFIFNKIDRLHRIHNADNYKDLSKLTSRFASSFLIGAKILVSLGFILIFYGYWLS